MTHAESSVVLLPLVELLFSTVKFHKGVIVGATGASSRAETRKDVNESTRNKHCLKDILGTDAFALS